MIFWSFKSLCWLWPGQARTSSWYLAGTRLTPVFLTSLFLCMSFHISYDVYLSSCRQRDWTLNMLGTSFWYFILNFLGRPKHLEQAGGLWIQSQLLFANSEESTF